MNANTRRFALLRFFVLTAMCVGSAAWPAVADKPSAPASRTEREPQSATVSDANAAGSDAPTPQDLEVAPPVSKLTRQGQLLKYDGAAARLVGYSDFDVITRSGSNIALYMREVKGHRSNPFVNLQRMWVHGYSGVSNGCPSTDDPCFCPITEIMPFNLSGGSYDVTGGTYNSTYLGRLDTMFANARKNGQIVELTLFDGWAFSSRYDLTPWHPNNSNVPACGASDNGACLPAGASDKDPFPEFYKVFLNPSNPDPINGLNQRGIWERNLVSAVMDVAKAYDNVFIEVMNEARHKRGSQEIPGADPVTVANWHKAVAHWVEQKNSTFLTSANVQGSELQHNTNCSLAGQPDAWEQELYSNNVHGQITARIRVVTLHYTQWRGPDRTGHPATAICKYAGAFNRPVLIDDDGTNDANREDANVQRWAEEVEAYAPTGVGHFNHLDYSQRIVSGGKSCFDCGTLDRLKNISKTAVPIDPTVPDGTWCDIH